jgi:hypothetical protein
VLSGGDAEDEQQQTAGSKPAPLRVVAERVERLRGLQFKAVPRAGTVTAAKARRTALADFDKEYPRSRRLADEELLKLLGLIPGSADLRTIVGDLFREQVAGFYDPKTKQLAVIGDDASGQGRALTEMTLAHELNHALEDQRFDLSGADSSAGIDDRALAELALTEGTATALMLEYSGRHIPVGETLAESLASGFGGAGTGELPPYVLASLLFPYGKGQPFVEALYNKLGGWGLVDYAYRKRKPSTSEQILHPEKYLRAEEALPVSLPGPPGRGWRRIVTGQIGEFDTAELLRAHRAEGAFGAAEGWGGGRYVLYRNGPVPDPSCPAPCRARDALVLRWRFDDAEETRQFVAAAKPWASRAGAMEVRGKQVTIVIAPPSARPRGLARAQP